MARFIQAQYQGFGFGIGQAEFEADIVAMGDILQGGAGRFQLAPYHAFERIRRGAG